MAVSLRALNMFQADLNACQVDNGTFPLRAFYSKTSFSRVNQSKSQKPNKVGNEKKHTATRKKLECEKP